MKGKSYEMIMRERNRTRRAKERKWRGEIEKSENKEKDKEMITNSGGVSQKIREIKQI